MSAVIRYEFAKPLVLTLVLFMYTSVYHSCSCYRVLCSIVMFTMLCFGSL